MSRDAIEKEKARAFRRRWALVNAREVEEPRATPPELKSRQLCASVDSVAALGWDAELAAGEPDVWERWRRARRAAAARARA